MLAVAERLLAIQGQDGRGFRLAIRSRTRGLTAADVDRELTERRSLVVTWLNRATLHLARSEDLHWLHALTTPGHLNWSAKRLGDLGVSPAEADRGIAVIESALAEEGPLTRAELGERLTATGVRTEGQALAHLLGAAGLRGLTVRGPMKEGEHAHVLVRDWLGEPPAVDRDDALSELARRYLAGHGPATDRDLARWSGLGLRDVRRGLGAIASELEEGPGGLVALAGRPEPAELPPPRLLGSFDPVLFGWVSREELLAEEGRVITRNGIFRPFALVDGRAAATWTLPKDRVELEPFAPLAPAAERALATDAQDVLRFLGR